MNRVLFLLFVLFTACGGKARGSGESMSQDEFQCKDRRVAYIVTGSFAGPELGVIIECEGRGPRISKWHVLSSEGDKKTMDHSLTPEEFDTLWEKIESTGWRNLGDCNNPEAVEGDPVYKIGIKDDSMSVSMTCEGKELPFPYNRLVNELDLKAAEYAAE